MEVSVAIPAMVAGTAPGLLIDWARHADSGPFASIGVGERINYDCCDAVTTLAAVAAVTTRVRILSALLVLPLHNTVVMAKQVATLDRLCGGRLTLGVGVGSRDEDYRSVGTSRARPVATLERQVERMRSIWRGRAVTPGGQPVGPTPVQKDGPPILVGAASAAAIRRAASWCDGYFPWSFEPDPAAVATLYHQADAAWAAAGRAGRPRRVAGFYAALGPRADEHLTAFVRHYHGHMGARRAAELAASARCRSTPALLATLRSFAEIGTDEVFLVTPTAEVGQLVRLADAIPSG